MPVYMVAVVKKKDKQKYNEYIAALTPIIEKYGGRYLVRGGRLTPLFKGTELERRRVDKVLIIEFPNAARHRRCFTSKEKLGAHSLNSVSIKKPPNHSSMDRDESRRILALPYFEFHKRRNWL